MRDLLDQLSPEAFLGEILLIRLAHMGRLSLKCKAPFPGLGSWTI